MRRGDALWRRRFGADPNIIGQTIELTSGRSRTLERFEVIGVLPPRFRFTYPEDTEVWLPLPWPDVAAAMPQSLMYGLIARLKPGVSAEAATSDMAAVVASMHADIPKGAYDRMRLWMEPVHEWSVGRVRPAVRLIVAVTGLLLLIACLNVASLLLAQTAPRRRDIALQQTLGASRGRLIRQMLTEAALLTAVSTTVAVAAVAMLQRVIRALLPPLMPRIDEVGIDLWTIGWTTSIGAATLILAGLMPSWRSTRVDPSSELVVGGRASSGGRVSARIRDALTAMQVAAASLMLIGGSLLLISLWNLHSVDLGFDGDAVLTQELRLMGPTYRLPGRQLAFTDELLRRVREIPGVRAAATTTAIPLSGTDLRRQYPIPGTAERVIANERYVDPAYFDVMRIPLVNGRLLTAADSASAPLVAVISQSLARALFPGSGALGRQLPIQRLATSGPPRMITGSMEIVGIVGDVRSVRVEDPGGPALYIPRFQGSFNIVCLVIRTDPNGSHVASSVRSVMREIDPNQPAGAMTTLEDVVNGTIADRRFLALATSAFASIALLLTVAGLYGVMAIAAIERARELGIRVALGATREALMAMLLRQGILPVLAGVALGFVAASWGMRLITSYLFGIQVIGAGVYALVTTVVVLGGLAACLFPARVGSRVDPMQALRSE